MTTVAIYMERGGNSSAEKAQLRQGMDAFLSELKSRAQSMRWRWKLVPCGSRRDAFEAFSHARRHADHNEVFVLLVDSEAPVTVGNRADHLRRRKGTAGASPASWRRAFNS